MTKHNLHPKTSLGFVHLTVSDLQRSLDFYQQALGLRIYEQDKNSAYLGTGENNLLKLTSIPGATLIPRRTGLYHFALLVPSRLALAKFLSNLVETQAQLQGLSDHLVSEAIYLADPDGNGIEVYRDRPRSDWEFTNGVLKMANAPFDIDGVLAELNGSNSWSGMEADTVLGHMHMHVANLPEAEAFYRDVIGLELMLSWGSAAFLSAGGYHHHIAINTWNGSGVAAPPPGSVGLRYFTLRLPGEDDLDSLIERLENNRVPYETDDQGLKFHDPSHNGIRVTISQIS